MLPFGLKKTKEISYEKAILPIFDIAIQNKNRQKTQSRSYTVKNQLFYEQILYVCVVDGKPVFASL